MPDPVKDILLDTDGDLQIRNNDLYVNESDQQHVEHILRANKGHYRQYPLVGIAVDQNLNGSINPQELKQEIKLQLIADNYTVKQIKIDEDFEISINAKRKL